MDEKELIVIFRNEWKKATNDFNFYPDCSISINVEKLFLKLCDKARAKPNYNTLIGKEAPIQARIMILNSFKEVNSMMNN